MKKENTASLLLCHFMSGSHCFVTLRVGDLKLLGQVELFFCNIFHFILSTFRLVNQQLTRFTSLSFCFHKVPPLCAPHKAIENVLQFPLLSTESVLFPCWSSVISFAIWALFLYRWSSSWRVHNEHCIILHSRCCVTAASLTLFGAYTLLLEETTTQKTSFANTARQDLLLPIPAELADYPELTCTRSPLGVQFDSSCRFPLFTDK